MSELEYEACYSAISEMEELNRKIETIHTDPDNYIYEYFEEIKRQVDLRRENLKAEIDQYSEILIKQINETQKSCCQLNNRVHEKITDIQVAKNEFIRLKESFDILQDSKLDYYNLFYSDTQDLKAKLDDLMDELKSSLIQNRYEFEFKQLDNKELFGEFVCYPLVNNVFQSSTILEKKNCADLLKLCGFTKQQQNWKLVYRASKDGFGSEKFHAKCDGISRTLTVIKSTNGNIFGGYTDQAWSSNDDWITDPNAFVFSLINKYKRPFKASCLNDGTKAIYCSSLYGPTFGGQDIRVFTNSNVNEFSVTCLSFRYGNYWPDDMNVLSGSTHFSTVDIEVYQDQI